jgi:hypothetical protein
LVQRLKTEGYGFAAGDVKRPDFSPAAADEFLVLDLREAQQARSALTLGFG